MCELPMGLWMNPALMIQITGAESSGNESCSRMRAAREARRREVPADARPPTDSSEVPRCCVA